MSKTKGLLFAVAVAAMAFTFSCSSDDGGGGGVWLFSNQKTYTVTDGVVVGVDSEISYTYTYVSYIDDKHYEYQYSYTIGSTQYSVNNSRNGNTGVLNGATIVYDEESGLVLSNGETNYTIVPLSMGGNVKTYRYYPTATGGTGAYSEYRVQNGVTLETKPYTAEGVLVFTLTYTFPDNATIRAKLPTFTLSSTTMADGSVGYQTCELVSDSSTELTIRVKNYNEGVLTWQQELTYVKHG